MDLAKIAALIRDLERTDAGWVAEAKRDVALRALVAESGQSLGPDATAWRRWYASVTAVAREGAAPSMSEPTARAAAALDEMGLLDLPELLAWAKDPFTKEPFADLSAELGLYLMNRPARGVRISMDPRYAPRTPYELEALESELRKMLGSSAVVAVEPRSGGFSLTIDEVRREAPDDLIFSTLVEALYAWAAARPEMQVVIDEGQALRVLTTRQIAAIRRFGKWRLVKLHPTQPSAPHPDVVATLEHLLQLGFDLSIPEPTLAFSPLEHPDRTLAAEIVRVADVGIRLGVYDEEGQLWRKLSLLTGVALAPRGSESELFAARASGRATALAVLLDDANAQLADAGAPLHAVLLKEGSRRFRLLLVPWDRVEALDAALGFLAGATVPPRRNRAPGPERFDARAALRIEDLAPEAPTTIVDIEIDGPDDCAEFATELLALAGLGRPEVTCVAKRNGRLAFAVATSAGPISGHLEGDWLDLDALLVILNRVAKQHGAPRRFVVFDAGGGQTAGVAWVTRSEAQTLFDAGLVEDRRW